MALSTAQPLLLFRVYCTTSRHVTQPRRCPPLSPSLAPRPPPSPPAFFFVSSFSSFPSLRLQRPSSPPPRRLYSAARRRLLWRRWGLQTAETLTPASFLDARKEGGKKCSGAAMGGWMGVGTLCMLHLDGKREGEREVRLRIRP